MECLPESQIADVAEMRAGPASPPKRRKWTDVRNRIASAGGEPVEHVAVQRWENEGGRSRDLRSVAITPTSVSLAVATLEATDPRLSAMRAKFLADFAEGRMGQHHNTFQHRSRVLRQLAEVNPTGDRLP
jgi:hypothetical protein